MRHLATACAVALLTAPLLAQYRPIPPPSPEVFAKGVRVGGDIPRPHKTKHVDPVYPKAARALSGIVIIDFVVGVKGNVTEARVIRSAPAFDKVAIAAVKQWRYEPTIFQGRAVPVMMTATLEFSNRDLATTRVVETQADHPMIVHATSAEVAVAAQKGQANG